MVSPQERLATLHIQSYAASVRMTKTTLKVLESFLATPALSRHGYDLLKPLGIKGGSLYPILERLEGEGWIVGTWHDSEFEGRPRRRSYLLTGLGVREAKIAVNEARIKSSPLNPSGVFG